MKKIVSIVGPTASGKTNISIEIAKMLPSEIVSCDSRQVYKGMDIGTSKPSVKERQNIWHHMIDLVNPFYEYNVLEFTKSARECIKDILKKKKIPLLVGGTGLYFDATVGNINFEEGAKDEEYRKHLFNLSVTYGNHHVHSMLKDIDQESYNAIHPNNLKRVIRALEIYKLTGRAASCRSFSKHEPIYDSLTFGLIMDRDFLYYRIEKRVDEMFKNGFVDEVKSLLNLGLNKSNTSMQAIGYREILDYLNEGGNKNSHYDVTKLVKQKTRNYAKRQITWFKKNKNIKWIILQKYYNVEEVAQNLFSQIKNFYIMP